MKALHIDSSITGEASVSRRLSAAVAGRLAEQGADVTRLDLAATPFPHLEGAEMAMARAGAEAIDDATAALAARSRAALDDFPRHEVVVAILRSHRTGRHGLALRRCELWSRTSLGSCVLPQGPTCGHAHLGEELVQRRYRTMFATHALHFPNGQSNVGLP